MTMLVCFTKKNEIKEVVDRQYHVFTACCYETEFVHDSLFKAFIEKHYTWSSVSFPILLAYKCDFTISNCCE